MTFDLEKAMAVSADMGFLRYVTCGDEELIHLCLNRVAMGTQRYEAYVFQYIHPEQDAILPKDWRYGWHFLDQDPGMWRKAYYARWKAYENSGNTELLLDLIVFAMFLHIVSDDPHATLLAGFARDEWVAPLHPNAHFNPVDQGIHGAKASGSVAQRARI